MTRPTLAYGSSGSDVTLVQTCLEVSPIDGDFGSITERAVRGFQRDQKLQDDGVVGPATWAALEKEFNLPPYPPPLPPPLPDETRTAILDIAAASQIARYSWKDRGKAPVGYIQGVSLAFADMVIRYQAEDSTAIECAKADTGDPDVDALNWYLGIFRNAGMDNSKDGLDTLRHLFVLMLGLGMRESSGKHCCGRDQSASNTDAITCEAGLYQMSWNASNASDEMQKLMDQYSGASSTQCALDVFSNGVTCSSADWKSYGSGDGYTYQQMAKHCPQFCVETAAVGLRVIRAHWGPINRREAEVRHEADELFKAVQEIILAPPMVA